jgi:hypothetical protein
MFETERDDSSLKTLRTAADITDPVADSHEAISLAAEEAVVIEK